MVRYPSVDGDIVVRCGVERPGDLAPPAAFRVVNPVQWFADTREGSGQAYVAVDRRPYVALLAADHRRQRTYLPISAAAISKTFPVAPARLRLSMADRRAIRWWGGRRFPACGCGRGAN